MYTALKALKRLLATDDARNDEVIQKILVDFREVFNKYRTHLRTSYPDQYRQIKNQLKEISGTGGGAGAASFSGGTGMQYATPYAFRRKGQKANDKAYKELGYTDIKEGIGANLGPGPKATEDGVKDNAYVKQFKYKLVPKNKKGRAKKKNEWEKQQTRKQKQKTAQPKTTQQPKIQWRTKRHCPSVHKLRFLVFLLKTYQQNQIHG